MRRRFYPPPHLNAHLAAIESHKAASLQFLITELDTATTFCQVALMTKNGATADRNLRNAVIARDTALEVRNRLTLSEDDKDVIANKLSRLDSLLQRVREQCQKNR